MSEHPQTFGKYEVLSILGRGGMGIVYQARDPIIGRVVAVKTISAAHDLSEDELRQRLQMEARSAGRLQHPNVATVYDFGTHEGTAYIVLEYVEGTDLAKVIDDKFELSLPKKLDILIQIAHGLAYAHELGVVHRDMKPSNVRLNTKGVPKIIDFGLARFDSTRLTKTGFMSGTIAYMSPERFQGEAGPSDDIFALGVIGYELLTYRRAFSGATPPEVMMKIMSQTLAAPSSVANLPAALDPILLKATAQVNERYASAAEYGLALEDFLDSPECIDFLARSGKGDASAPRRKRTAAFASLSGQRTVQIGAEAGLPTAIIDPGGLSTAEVTHVEPVAGPPADATLVTREPVVGGGRGWRRWSWAAALAAVVVIVTMLATRGRTDRTGEPPATARPIRPSTTSATQTMPVTEGQTARATADVSALANDVEVRRQIFASLRNDVVSFDLDRNEKDRLNAADLTARLAEEKYGERDYAESARLLSTVIEELRGLQKDHYDRFRQQTVAAPKTPPRKSAQQPPPRSSTAADSGRAAPPPAEIAARTESAEHRPPATETVEAVVVPPVPARPTREEIARRVTAFISRVARAYESRDVAFFRDHDAHFSERTASAVRASPSTGVQMKVQAIDHSSDERIRVTVVRTDTFKRADMPPGIQTLVYTIQPAGDSWRIVSIDRR